MVEPRQRGRWRRPTAVAVICAMVFGVLSINARAFAAGADAPNFSGTVDGPDGTPLSAGVVVAWASSSTSTGAPAQSPIGAGGSFSLTLSPGSYEYEVIPAAQSTCATAACLIPLFGHVDLTSAPQTGKTLTLPTPNVFGTVKDPGGKGLANAGVFAYPQMTTSSTLQQAGDTSAADGTYGLSLSADSYPADFVVSASPPPDNPGHLVGSRIDVSLASASPVSGEDITLPAATLF
ncbi:MAG TPA: hypothetical protein VFH45_11740, partial [Acidimicrobiales bacterium]|nr:hypothetical protein [Acidimicrobiales bacterium]